MDLSHTLESGVVVKVKSDSDWWVFNEVFVDGDYDEAIELAVSHSPESVSPFVLDLGSNVGFFAARFVDKFLGLRPGAAAELLLVEGSPGVYDDLSGRVEQLRVPGITIEAVNGLIGDREGSGTISEVAFGARNTVHPEHNAGIEPVSEMAHHRVSFVDLAASVGNSKRISLLKCDIEGSEETFLETYRTDLLPITEVAVFELHRTLCDTRRCLSILDEAGLKVVSSVDQQDDTALVVLERR